MATAKKSRLGAGLEVQRRSREEREAAARGLNVPAVPGGVVEKPASEPATPPPAVVRSVAVVPDAELPQLVSEPAPVAPAGASGGLAAAGLKQMKLTIPAEEMNEIRQAAMVAGLSAREFVRRSALGSARKVLDR